MLVNLIACFAFSSDAIPRPPIPFGATCTPKLLGTAMDAAGHDLAQATLPTAEECTSACCANPKCGGALFEPASGITWHNCTKGQPCCFLKTSVSDAQPGAGVNSSLFQMMGRSQDDETLHFVSATLGSHMVLQSAPQQAVVWGFTAPGATVTTTMVPSNRVACEAALSTHACTQQTFETTAAVDGTWRQRLPATPPSKAAFELSFASSNSTAERAQLSDVLFGDVFICGGQSNMEFAMPAVANTTAEQQAANAYPHIRIFSVGHRTSSPTPLRDLQTVWEGWQVASNTTIDKDFSAHSHLFATFSAVCWLYGRALSDALSPTGDHPIGLISNNWGGTKLEVWAPATSFAPCNVTPPYVHGGPMYNAMILPYAAGPMALSGFVWYQGEADTASAASASQYACTFPQMISSWRDAFNAPEAVFLFVQLSTWCANPPSALPLMRQAQMAALALDRVGYATNADHGMGCNIHPAAKQYVGARLANAALGVHYDRPVLWRSPTYRSATQRTAVLHSTKAARAPSTQPALVSLAISLNDVGWDGLRLVERPYNYESPNYGDPSKDPPVFVNCSATYPISPTQNGSMAEQCAWAALNVRGVGWLNATVSLEGKSGLVLTAHVPSIGHASVADDPFTVVGSAYGWGPIPMLVAYDVATRLPVLPWNETAP